jgi:pyridoxine 5-phosphate synthase
MARLAVNVDHVATIRQARGTIEPDPVIAAGIAELAGAEGIICHLREDRRHINDRDLRLLRQTVKTKLNLEMAAVEEMMEIALEVRPDLVTLVPEKRMELTTEGGLDVLARPAEIREVCRRMREAEIGVSLFVDPVIDQIKASADCGADIVEIHTGRYADAVREKDALAEFNRIEKAAEAASSSGLKVSAGHGLNYFNIIRFRAIPIIEEYSIGHSIVSRAVMVGLERAVRDMVELVRPF